MAIIISRGPLLLPNCFANWRQRNLPSEIGHPTSGFIRLFRPEYVRTQGRTLDPTLPFLEAVTPAVFVAYSSGWSASRGSNGEQAVAVNGPRRRPSTGNDFPSGESPAGSCFS